MPICPKCGLKIGENWNFCPCCGSTFIPLAPDNDPGENPDYAREQYRRISGDQSEMLQHEEDLVNWFKAVETYQKAEPDYYYAYNNVGLDQLHRGEYDLAVECFKTAITLKPNFAEAYYNLASAYGHLNRLDEAISLYRQAVQIDPSFAEAHYTLGVSYFKQGDYRQAIQSYEKAIAIKPDFSEAFYNLGVTYLFTRENHTKAMMLIEKAAELGNDAAAEYLAKLEKSRQKD